jgi:hypothetical protein
MQSAPGSLPSTQNTYKAPAGGDVAEEKANYNFSELSILGVLTPTEILPHNKGKSGQQAFLFVT